LLGQGDESFQASPHRGSTVRADAHALFPYQIVRTEVTVYKIRNILAVCCFSEWFAKQKLFNDVFITNKPTEC
jgi:hypothetical protein